MLMAGIPGKHAEAEPDVRSFLYQAVVVPDNVGHVKAILNRRCIRSIGTKRHGILRARIVQGKRVPMRLSFASHCLKIELTVRPTIEIESSDQYSTTTD